MISLLLYMADIVLPITSSMVVTAIGVVVWWYIVTRIKESKQRRETHEAMLKIHIEECNKKAVTAAVTEERMCNFEDKMDRMEKKIDGVILTLATTNKVHTR